MALTPESWIGDQNRPIKTIGYNNKKYSISQKSQKSISSNLLKTLNSIKYGESEDKFGWIYKLN